MSDLLVRTLGSARSWHRCRCGGCAFSAYTPPRRVRFPTAPISSGFRRHDDLADLLVLRGAAPLRYTIVHQRLWAMSAKVLPHYGIRTARTDAERGFGAWALLGLGARAQDDDEFREAVCGTRIAKELSGDFPGDVVDVAALTLPLTGNNQFSVLTIAAIISRRGVATLWVF